MRDRKDYIKNSYSKYWLTARKNIYGFMPYDKAVLEVIEAKATPESEVLEVAIGTGYPFADSLSKRKYKVYGIDLSPDLINACLQLNSKIMAKVGDAENLEYSNNYFDTVYCMHSSWYLPNLNKAISEMYRVTKDSGHIIFDIQNLNNAYINSLYTKHVFYNSHLLGMFIKSLRNAAKFILQKGVQNWPFIVSETPSVPENLMKKLTTLGVKEITIMARKENDSVEIVDDSTFRFTEYDRLIFCIIK